MSFEERFNQALDRLWAWAARQVGFAQGSAPPPKEVGFQPSRWTGTFVLVAFVYQVMTGGLLLLYYQPSVSPTLTLCGQAPGVVSSSPAAWCSTYFIVHSVPLGAVLLTIHLYGAYALIFLVLLHLFWGYFVGSYKRPGRTFSWLVGVVLLLLVLGMGFTGYLLTYTQLSYNATQVSITLLQALPGVGPPLAHLLLGDGTPQSLLSRAFAFHVVLLPVAIAVLVFLHKRTPLFPRVFASLVKWALLYGGVLVGVASIWLWSLPTYAGNTSVAQPTTVPPWYFLWVFKLVDFTGVTPEDAMLFAVVVLLFLIFLPFLDRSPSQDIRDRPVFLFLGISLLGFFLLMTAWGALTPGVPISPAEAALRLGPMLAANALAVGLGYRQYRRSGGGVPKSGGPAPTGPPAEAPVEPAGAPERRTSWTVTLSVGGLVGSLFLVAFGLWLPFVFLLAAFLISLAEASRRPSAAPGAPIGGASGTLAFSAIGFLAVVFLLVALVVVVLF